MAEIRVKETGTIKLFESDNTSSVTVASPASLGADRTVTLPDASVTLASGTMLATDGSGASLTALNASELGSGTVPTARLGTGTASSSTILYGDQTYKTEPASGLSKMFLAYPSADFNITNNTTHIAELDAEAFDTQSGFNTSTFRYTIQTGDAGKWLIGSTMQQTHANGMREAIGFVTCNGAYNTAGKTMYPYWRDTDTNLQYVSIDTCGILDLSEGDYLRLECHMEGVATDGTVKGGNNPYETFFWGVKLD